MSDKKISALTAATTPLAGSEVLPIVQGGTTKKVAVSDVAALATVNLTGPITSVGAATSIASQTGTGSTFVMSVSPTLTGTIAGANQTLSGTLGVTGVATFSADPLFNSTGAILVSKGNTAARPIAPTLASGMFRFNTTTSEFEGYNGTAWASVGGAAITNDTTTATDIFPLSASATTGTASTVFTSNSKLLYKPSTGDFQASQVVASNGLFVNKTTVATSYTIASGYNAMSVGPVTISSGIVVTVSSGQRWLVL